MLSGVAQARSPAITAKRASASRWRIQSSARLSAAFNELRAESTPSSSRSVIACAPAALAVAKTVASPETTTTRVTPDAVRHACRTSLANARASGARWPSWDKPRRLFARASSLTGTTTVHPPLLFGSFGCTVEWCHYGSMTSMASGTDVGIRIDTATQTRHDQAQLEKGRSPSGSAQARGSTPRSVLSVCGHDHCTVHDSLDPS